MGVTVWHTCGDFKIVRNKVSNSKIGIFWQTHELSLCGINHNLQFYANENLKTWDVFCNFPWLEQGARALRWLLG